MAFADTTTWIEQSKARIFERCLSALQGQKLGVLTLKDNAQLREELVPLCNVILDATAHKKVASSTDLIEWTERHQREHNASLSDLLKLSAVVRTVFREAVWQADDTLLAVDTWERLAPIFDQIAELLSETYIDAIKQRLTERLQESEYLTASLVQATEEADKAVIRLRSIYDISQALLGTSLAGAEETFDRLAQELGAALQVQHCAIWLRDVGLPYAVATYTEDQTPAPKLSENVEESVFGAVLQSGKSQILTRGSENAISDERLLDTLHASSLLLAPFVVQEIPIGVVTLGRQAGKSQFDSTEMTLVESVVTQAAVAVQNAGLYEEIRDLNRSLEARVVSRTRELAREKERIETLYAVGQELGTTLDLDQVLEKTLGLITRAVNAQYGAIMVIDAEKSTLSYIARAGDQSLAMSDSDTLSLCEKAGLVGRVIRHREAVMISDKLDDEQWGSLFAQESKVRSLIAAPLVIGEHVQGVLLTAKDMSQAFDQDQKKLISASAQQIAQAMSNAQLYRREQEERTKTQAVLQSIADGVIVNDIEDNVIVFNTAAEEILGLQHTDVLGQSVWRLFDVFEENGRSDALEAMEAISSSPRASIGQLIETTLEVCNKVISAHMAPVVTESQEALGVVTVLRDITREVQADRAKSEFVSTVSHELRTPLTSIKGYTDLIHGGAVGSISEQQKRFLGIIKGNADRLTALINDLLDISRIESGRVQLKIESLKLAEIVNEVVVSLRTEIEAKGLRLELDISEQTPEIMGDRARIIQIVTNMISNALKYTDYGWIQIGLCALEEAVRLDVADSGIGISNEDQGRVFERFYRANTPVMEGRGGTGLGLAITKELVELHGGRLWVESESGVGSTFTIILPTAAQDLPPHILTELPAGAKKILVVDDERDILALLRHQLAMNGYHVITAATGGQAITKAIEEQPDLITLDVLLPDRHGFDVLRELKARQETMHIPVIVLSVVQDEINGYRLGAVDYIVKPLDEQRLLSSVSHILSRKGKILIAEDTEDTAEMLIDLLSGHGYEILHATNGYEVLAVARRECPDLILLDLRMPGMDGYEALTRLKKDPETRNIPIMVMSAHAADPMQERLRVQAMGAEAFISKPFSLENLLEGIHRVALEETDFVEPVNEQNQSEATIGGTELVQTHSRNGRAGQ